jgi:hypothetical protein
MSRARWLALPALVIAACALILWWPAVRDEAFVIAGSRDEAGGWYGWWSGQAGGLQPLEWLALGVLIWWHHQCGVHRCYWYARRTTAAGERACWRHHPDPVRTARDVRAAHHAAAKRP